METFSALLALYEGSPSVTVDSPHKGQWRGALMCFFDLRLNERVSNQWRWFETPSHPLWRHRNIICLQIISSWSSTSLTTSRTRVPRYIGMAFINVGPPGWMELGVCPSVLSTPEKHSRIGTKLRQDMVNKNIIQSCNSFHSYMMIL